MSRLLVILVCFSWALLGVNGLAKNIAKPCKDDQGILQPVNKDDFSCKNECNTCQHCSCDNGKLKVGNDCTKIGCEDRGCKVGDKVHPLGSSGFQCRDKDDCNACSSCSCSDDGVLKPDGCTKIACVKLGQSSEVDGKSGSGD